MKILYYSPHPHLSFQAQTGYGTHMREMVKAFREHGAEVELLIMGGEKTGSSTITNPPGNLKRLAKKIVPPYVWRTLKEIKLRRTDQAGARRLEEAIQRFRPDFVYERTAWMSESGSVSGKYNVPHFCEVNAPFEYEVRQFEGSGSWMEKAGRDIFGRLVRNSSHVFPVSSALRDYLIKEHKVDAEKITVVPNAIDADSVVIDEAQVAMIRAKYSLVSKTVIGFVGSIFPYHGVDELIEAFSELYRTDTNLALVIVGDGLIIDDLKELARTKGCAGAVHFTGSVPKKEIFNYISLCDITVLAKTNWYCSPIKLFEYGYLGKPVVAPDTKAVRDVMDENCGWLIKPGTKDLLASLRQILSDQPAANAKARVFAARIRDQHLWKKNAEAVLNIFNHKSVR